MPYTVKKDESACSAAKPWAVKNKNTGAVVPGGCHATKDEAIKHLGALESNVESTRLQADALVTIPNIELISVGSWKAMGNSPGKSGEVVFTEDDLANIMASLAAPDVKEPRMILGHTGATVPASTGDDGFYGEQPTIGKFTNLQLVNEGTEIMADLVGVPKWLADIIPTAYPQRSVEVYWDVPSGIPGAAAHACVMPRVALLGVNLPAVATLDDLKVLYSEEGPEIEEPDTAHASRRVAASKGDFMPERAAASVQFEDVRRDFYNDFATEESGRYWWWIKSVYVDPPLIIADDDEDGLWSVGYSVGDEGVTFDDPIAVNIQYVDKESGKVAAQAAPVGEQYTKAESRPSTRTKETKAMDIDVAALRTLTGLTPEQLPDDATEEQVKTTIAEAAEAATAAAKETPGEPAPDDDGGEDDERQPAPAAAAAQPSDTVRIDRETWESTQRTIAELSNDRQERVAASMEDEVKAAIKAGKIPPSRKDHYVKLMTADPEGTRALLGELESVIPVEQRETGFDDGGDSTQAAAGADYDLSWLTEAERKRALAARAGEVPDTPRLVMEA